MSEGIEKSRTNMSAAAGTAYSVPVYTVTSGRTFILTDLIVNSNGREQVVYMMVLRRLHPLHLL